MLKILAALGWLIFGSTTTLLAQNAAFPGDVGALTQTSKTRFTIVTQKGHVSFDVPNQWSVLMMRSKPPVTAAIFQIGDASDQGLPDSTNVAVNLLTAGNEAADRELAKLGTPYGGAAVERSNHGDWTIYRQNANQGETEYTVLDATQKHADVVVTVRLAWPKLRGHAADHPAQMQKIFDELLESFASGLGAYTPAPGEVLRRPS